MSIRSKQSATARLQSPEDEVSELAQLRQLVDDLRQAVRARDDFIAIAAHELRNPMTPIVGVAELALDQPRGKPKAAARRASSSCWSVCSVSSRTMLRRATRLLDVSRIEAGNLRLEPADDRPLPSRALDCSEV